ncbi:hypothetical protein EKO04_005817 [Ascochyta lentis]|uniref:Probable Xaa-Pro aminopeptidase P n=1 Tax=Ascochyta lentis TaxID=205686 RepID=A0A8H7MJI4_9PLEO|nr:hypothetical protein EKO04_005817 [Ascochyta lentis]
MANLVQNSVVLESRLDPHAIHDSALSTLNWHTGRDDLADAQDMALLDQASDSIEIDMKAVRAYRLSQTREQMASHNIDACLFGDPINIRYATGARNMQICTARMNTARYLLLTANCSILFDFHGCAHLAAGLETIDEIRVAKTVSHQCAGHKLEERERTWTAEMAELIISLVGKNATIGLERLNANVAINFKSYGFTIVDAQKPIELARCIKSPEELKCVIASLRATESAVKKLNAAIRPGITENALWSILHQSIIEDNGEYPETRLLTAGPRTCPWFQETSPYTIQENELIALDTDVVGCHGYYCDFSRTFHAGPDAPSAAQKELYRTAHSQIVHNIAVLRPGMSFREFADSAWDIPEEYRRNRYILLAHGCGMACEYPYLYHKEDFEEAGYDGVIEAGMVLCVESYIGADGGKEGVKLEQEVLITETGVELLSEFPFERRLLE